MHTFYILWSVFFDICRLRAGPQDLPTSSVLLGLSLIIYMITGVINGLLSPEQLPFTKVVAWSVIETVLLVLLTSSLLHFAHYSARVMQTLTAVAGTSTQLSIISMPFIFWFAQAKHTHSDPTLPLLLLLSLSIWSLTVYAHILRHALMVPFFVGLMLAMTSYSLIAIILYQLIN